LKKAFEFDISTWHGYNWLRLVNQGTYSDFKYLVWCLSSSWKHRSIRVNRL